MDALDIFSQSQSDSQKSAAEAALNNASADAKGKSIDIPGTYRVRTKSVNTKKGVWPRFEISDQPKTKGDLVLKLLLECVDGTGVVAKGDTIFHNIYVKKGAGATDEKIRNTASYAKPQLCALTGRKDMRFSDADLRSFFTVDVDAQGKITRQHKMTAEVMVVCENSVSPTTGKSYFSIKSMRPAAEGDHSISVKSSAPVSDGALASEIRSSQGELKTENMDMSFDGDVPTETVEDS